jgi:hypothetical protein
VAHVAVVHAGLFARKVAAVVIEHAEVDGVFTVLFDIHRLIS